MLNIMFTKLEDSVIRNSIDERAEFNHYELHWRTESYHPEMGVLEPAPGSLKLAEGREVGEACVNLKKWHFMMFKAPSPIEHALTNDDQRLMRGVNESHRFRQHSVSTDDNAAQQHGTGGSMKWLKGEQPSPHGIVEEIARLQRTICSTRKIRPEGKTNLRRWKLSSPQDQGRGSDSTPR